MHCSCNTYVYHVYQFQISTTVDIINVILYTNILEISSNIFIYIYHIIFTNF